MHMQMTVTDAKANEKANAKANATENAYADDSSRGQ